MSIGNQSLSSQENTLQSNHPPTVNEVLHRSHSYLVFFYRVLCLVCVLSLLTIFADGDIHRAIPFGVIAAGCICQIAGWIRRDDRLSIPVVSFVVLQDLIWYGMPLVANNDELSRYTHDEILETSLCFAVYFIAIYAGWSFFFTRSFRTPTLTRIVDSMTWRGALLLQQVAFLAFGICLVCELGLIIGWIWPLFDVVGYSFINPFRTAIAVCEASATIFICWEAGQNRLGRFGKSMFFSMWVCVFLIRISTFLLSTVVLLAVALLLGLYIGSQKVPWKSAVAITLALAFFNISKHQMRQEYVNEAVSMQNLPLRYVDWANKSVSFLFGRQSTFGERDLFYNFEAEKTEGQTLYDRISNVQMLLYVCHRIEHVGDPLLYGKTYAKVPTSLVPRFIWKDKPRTHIAQEILNVHFGRQTYEQTFTTYIAWGLLPESVGNFGRFLGPLFLGLTMGLAGGWLEARVRDLPLLSLWSLIVIAISLFLCGSTGMVSTVLLSAMGQFLLVLAVGISPFLKLYNLHTNRVIG